MAVAACHGSGIFACVDFAFLRGYLRRLPARKDGPFAAGPAKRRMTKSFYVFARSAMVAGAAREESIGDRH